MNRLSFLVILSIFSFGLLCSAGHADTFSAQALTTTENYASIMDDKKYQTAYMEGADLLRLVNPEHEWIDKAERTRKLLGKVQQRKLKAVRAVSTYPGLPDGNYLLVYFEAQTERKAKAAEVILVGQVGNTWQVCSYSIR